MEPSYARLLTPPTSPKSVLTLSNPSSARQLLLRSDIHDLHLKIVLGPPWLLFPYGTMTSRADMVPPGAIDNMHRKLVLGSGPNLANPLVLDLY